MVQDRDFDGCFRKCLQCGRIVDLGMETPPLAAAGATAAAQGSGERLAA